MNISRDLDLTEKSEEGSVSTATPRYLGARAIGPLHVQLGTPCQDAWYARVGEHGWVAVAVADGLGSAPHSDVGAELVVHASVVAALSKLGQPEFNEGELQGIAKDAVAAARAELVAYAEDEGWEPRAAACTLMLLVSSRKSTVVAHIGDGAVVGQRGDELLVLSDPGESEYANEVTPLTSSDWEESLRVSGVHDDLTAAAVFTDGLQRAALRKVPPPMVPFPGFWTPLFRFAYGAEDLLEAQTDLERLLSSPKICENSEDDKTLVFVILEER